MVELASKKHRRVDLFASALGVSIVGSNKSGGVKDSWSAHVNDWDEIRRCAKADTALFVVTDKELSVDDKRYVKDKGLCLWTEDDVSY
ncbi:MAG TPA: hypothetical protein VN862_02990 [Candidatus Acidoferrales bacterium]|nr:hypothetical protein [Candidatus Acidoferrales bacterium]